MRGGTGRKRAYLVPFGRIESIFFNDLWGKHLAPKAEVTGSNPVGCANDFNGLRDWFEGSGRGYFRIILVVVVPFVSDIRIAQLQNFDNWKWKVNAGVSRKSRALHYALSTIEPIPPRPSIAS
jgi:hypothetical protein